MLGPHTVRISPGDCFPVRRFTLYRPGPVVRLAPALLCMAVIFALSSRSTLPKPANVSGEVFSVMGHFGAYFALGIALWWALGLGRSGHRLRILLAWVGAVLYGISDEFHQSFVPNRTPEVGDVVVDAIGSIVGILIVAFIARHFGPTAPARPETQRSERGASRSGSPHSPSPAR